MIAKKCTGCGADKFFDPESGKLKCEHCGGEYALEGVSASGNILKNYTPEYAPTKREDEERHYECTSCGSVVTFKAGESLRCPSCGDVALEEKRIGVCIPDGIIPFRVGKKRASEYFWAWAKKKKLAPNDFKRLAKLGKISGQYVPVWAYNFNLSGSYRGQVSYTVHKKDNKSYTVTKPIWGKVNRNFINECVSGTVQMPDKNIRELAPFNVEGTRAFSNEYLFGFSGLDTNRNAGDAHRAVIDFATREIERDIRSDEGSGKYSVDWLDVNVTPSNETLRYVYAPVWASHFSYKKKKYHAFVNGETGTVSGSYPISGWKVFFIILGILAAVGGFVALIKYLK